MNLKESYRYMNYLDKLLYSAQNYLSSKDFITTTKQEHLRQKANSDAENETVKVQKPYDVEFTPMDIVNFVVKVLSEKETLSSAITNAKKSTEIDIDHSVAMNKKRQEFVSKLSYMANLKNSEKKSRGTDYKINPIDGNQMSYYYDVNEVTTIDFDRTDIKGLVKKFTKECDDISAKLDKIQIDTEVDFNPTWDISDSLEDAILV